MVNDTNSQRLKDIGLKLRDIRLAKHITQKEAAKAAGVSQSFLSSAEHGKKAYSLIFILRLIEFYGVSYEAVFGENKEFFSPMTSEHIESNLHEYLDMLLTLTFSCCEEITAEAKIYMILSIYRIFRHIYGLNPYSSDKIFSLDCDEAEKLSEDKMKIIIEECPKIFKRITRSKPPELPIEMNTELRDFIRSCEKFLR